MTVHLSHDNTIIQCGNNLWEEVFRNDTLANICKFRGKMLLTII